MRSLSLLLIILCSWGKSQSQTLYFPPVTGNTWETMAPSELGWCPDKIQQLYQYLESTNSKAFIVLKDGRIVLEKYFGNFTQDSLWVWNSAGKTLTAFTVGIAQREGYLSIEDTTSNYLGTGWTSLTPAQEAKITIRHQLTMTTGLNDSNFDCTDPACLTYLTEPGTRWAYHNGPYTILDDVISAATGQTLNSYVTQKVKALTGMTGVYYPIGYNNVFISNARSMARFGLLLLARGTWNGNPVLGDAVYFDAMTHPAQTINPAYGYLTWLNGQSSYMIPQAQLHFPGSIMPNAPSGVFAALGKNGQLINVNPDHNLVFIRMGQNDGNSLVSTQYNDTVWQKINLLNCTGSISENQLNQVHLYPNPGKESVNILSAIQIERLSVIDSRGKSIPAMMEDNKLDISTFSQGMYFVLVQTVKGEEIHKLIVE